MGRPVYVIPCPPSGFARGYCYTVSAQYNLAGDLTQLTYPDGRVVAYNYNSGDQLNLVRLGGYNYWSVNDAIFYPSGTPKLAALGNGVVESPVLNKRLQLQQDTVSNPALGTLADHAYNYGTQNNGNILSVADQLNSSRTQNFSYDQLNRLATANESRWGLQFTYDPWGNFLQQSLTAGYATQHQYTVASNNRLDTYNYDAAGNMLNDHNLYQPHTFTYDGASRIKQVTGGDGATYTYDPDGNRVRKDTGSTFTEYLYFGGNVIAEQDQAGNWSDYIYAGGKRIAKSDSFKGVITTTGTQCSNCGWQWNIFVLPGNLNNQGYVVRPGDQLVSRQWSSATGRGGINLWFTDGTSTIGTLDQDGQPTNNDTITQTWHYRRVDLSAYAGKTIGNTALVTEGFTPAGSWTIAYTDLALISTDGTVWPFYTGQNTVNLSPYGADGSTRTYAVGNQPGYGWPAMSTVYYHGDQIGSARLITNYNGYPVWQGTLLPYGGEYDAQIGANHYKFTGKERDDESGLDYFGARYYSNGLGRFMQTDPLWVKPDRMFDHHRLNLYSYGRNKPLKFTDPTGMDVVIGKCSGGDQAKCFDLLQGGLKEEDRSHVHSVVGDGKNGVKKGVLGVTVDKDHKSDSKVFQNLQKAANDHTAVGVIDVLQKGDSVTIKMAIGWNAKKGSTMGNRSMSMTGKDNPFEGYTFFEFRGKSETGVIYTPGSYSEIVVNSSGLDDLAIMEAIHHEMAHLVLGDFGRSAGAAQHSPTFNSDRIPHNNADRETLAAEQEVKSNATPH